MSTEKNTSIENRLIEDTVGATVGAATGVSISTLIGFMLPAISSLVPLGLITGTIAGVVFKEFVQRRQ